jgi:hypothetical protein
MAALPNYSWSDVNPDNSQEWTCLYCNAQLITSRSHFYNHHARGKCLAGAGAPAPAPAEDAGADDGSPADTYEDDEGEQHAGAAAAFARRHDAAVADFQQLLVEAGLTEPQLRALLPGLQQLAGPFKDLLAQLADGAEDDNPDADVEADIRQQHEALRQRLGDPLCQGKAPVTALEGAVRLFEWRCTHSIKVS